MLNLGRLMDAIYLCGLDYEIRPRGCASSWDNLCSSERKLVVKLNKDLSLTGLVSPYQGDNMSTKPIQVKVQQSNDIKHSDGRTSSLNNG